MDVLAAVEASGDEHLKEKFQCAVGAVQRTFDLFGQAAVAFSFNGGKDSTVLLHILRVAVALAGKCDAAEEPDAAAARQQSNAAAGTSGTQPHSGLGAVRTFIFKRRDDFPEILAFVRAMNTRYSLRLEELEGDFRVGLAGLIRRSGIKAIVLGTRRRDPNAEGQDAFCPSSAGWPPFMRVNPVLDWGYGDVWALLRAARLPYCALYDRGFTSIGSVTNTRPNSALCKEDGSFAPAHMLADARLERAGRAASPDVELERRRSDAGARGRPSATRTAALVVVGDEILAARVDDVNTRFLCRELRALGWRVCKAELVPDEVDAIAAAVRAASDAADVAITSGGLGPTPDDVTMAGVAAALGHPLGRDCDLEARLRDYFGPDITRAHLKMAEAPVAETAILELEPQDGRTSAFPVVRARNVYVLPGVPELLRQKWQAVRAELAAGSALAPFRSVSLRLAPTDEAAVAPALEALHSEFDGGVAVGSYPVSGQADGAGLVLSLEGKDARQLEAASSRLASELPAGTRLVSMQHDAACLDRLR
ncbi:hypothetical protein WJX81_008521 [Elliptochloris bilobata]|uniref:FAD synthase n=1 Tax=Elliptochloris bilobata TaxID=381761 RepID=A0AAW1RCU5_9CHLO